MSSVRLRRNTAPVYVLVFSLSHSCERPYAHACIVRANEPKTLEPRTTRDNTNYTRSELELTFVPFRFRINAVFKTVDISSGPKRALRNRRIKAVASKVSWYKGSLSPYDQKKKDYFEKLTVVFRSFFLLLWSQYIFSCRNTCLSLCLSHLFSTDFSSVSPPMP